MKKTKRVKILPYYNAGLDSSTGATPMYSSSTTPTLRLVTAFVLLFVIYCELRGTNPNPTFTLLETLGLVELEGFAELMELF